MSDTTYQVFQHYGTAAERALFTPNPAAGIQPIYIWYETDTGDTYLYDTSWHLLSAAGGGIASMFAVSNTTQSTSGTANLSALSFAGAGIASVGITNGSVLVSVPAGGGGITNVNLSAGTTSNNLSNFVLSNSNNVSFGLSGSTITATATVASTQGSVRISAGTTSILSSAFTFSNSNNVSFGINTNGVVTGSATVASTQGSIKVSAGTQSSSLSALTFANSNGVSFGLDAGTITATVKTDYLTTAMASNRGSDFVQATATVAGTNISGTIASNVISLSVAAPGAANINVSAGTTSNNLTNVVFSNSNNVSFGINGSTVTATATVASTQGSINVSAGTTSGNVSAVTFNDSNGVSFGYDNGSITATVKTNYLTTAMASNRGSDFVQATATVAGTNISGTIASNVISLSVAAPGAANINVSAGTTSNDLTQVVFSNSNNVSFGLNGSTVTATATVASTQGSIRISAGTTSALSSAFTFSNSNNVSFGIDAGTVTATATVASTQGSIRLSAGTTSILSSGFTFSDSNRVSFGVNTDGVVTAKHALNFSAGTTSNNVSDQLVFSNSNNVSFGLNGSTVTATATVASTQASISFSAGTTSNNSSGFTLSNSNNVSFGLNAGVFTATATVASTQGSIRISAGTTSVLSSGFTLSDSNNVSFGINNGTLTATATFAQSNQSLGLYMSSNTTSSVSSGTVDARSLTFRGMGIASVGYSGGEVILSVPAGGGGLSNIRVSAGTTSNLLSDITFADSNGISFGINASTITATVGTYSTVGTATTGYSVASANSVGTVTRWAAEDHRHAGVGGIGISTAGNTAGTTGSQLGTYWLQGSNLTLSQITSNNGSHTLVISARNNSTQSMWANIPHMIGTTAITQSSGSSVWVQPFTLDQNVSVSYLRMLASWNDSAVGTAGTPVINSTFSVARFTTFGVVIYSQGVGASSESIQSIFQTTAGMSGTTQCGAGAQSSRYTITISKSYPALGFTTNLYTSSYAVSSASIVVSSNSNTLFTGPRFLDIPFATLLTPGNYWLGIGASTSSTSNSANISFAGTAALPISIIGNSQFAESVGILGAVTSASRYQIYPGLGAWTTNASTITKDSIAISQVSQVASNPQIPFQLILQS